MGTLLYSGSRPLVLASGSPRRRELLARLGVSFEVEPADVDEAIDPDLAPADLAVDLAVQKARVVADRRTEGVVLGADTIVVRDGVVLGKPMDPEDARRMFASLCGRAHVVITGLALIDVEADRVYRAYEETVVSLRAATPGEVDAYVETGEPLDKAGSYGAQAVGAVFIHRVEGCFYNVVGLPLARLHAMFRELEPSAPGAGATPVDREQ